MLKKDINNGILSVSQLIENEDNCFSMLHERDKEEFLRRNYIRKEHRLQFIASRLLLQSSIETDFEMLYKGLNAVEGVPQPIEGKQISISHSKQLVAVAVAGRPIGIDLQIITPKAQRVAHRVFSELEINKSSSLVDLTLLWAVKEAFYKYIQIPGLDFKTDMSVDEWSVLGDQIKGCGKVVVDGKLEKINFEGLLINEEYVLVYTA